MSILGCIVQIEEGEAFHVMGAIIKQMSYLVWSLLSLYTLENQCLDVIGYHRGDYVRSCTILGTCPMGLVLVWVKN
jgi:hypothetical protein